MPDYPMTYSDKHGAFFGRTDDHGNVAVLHVDDGSAATRLDASVYPVTYREDDNGSVIVGSSELSARYEHAAGIVLTLADAQTLGIAIE
jgi:hypothetical protein